MMHASEATGGDAGGDICVGAWEQRGTTARFDREEMVPVGGVPSARMIYRVDRS